MVLRCTINNFKNKSMQGRSLQLMMQLTLYADDLLCPLFFSFCSFNILNSGVYLFITNLLLFNENTSRACILLMNICIFMNTRFFSP